MYIPELIIYIGAFYFFYSIFSDKEDLNNQISGLGIVFRSLIAGIFLLIGFVLIVAIGASFVFSIYLVFTKDYPNKAPYQIWPLLFIAITGLLSEIYDSHYKSKEKVSFKAKSIFIGISIGFITIVGYKAYEVTKIYFNH
jgi:hypothetical protein